MTHQQSKRLIQHCLARFGAGFWELLLLLAHRLLRIVIFVTLSNLARSVSVVEQCVIVPIRRIRQGQQKQRDQRGREKVKALYCDVALRAALRASSQLLNESPMPCASSLILLLGAGHGNLSPFD